MLRLKKFIRATSNSAMAHNNRNIGKPKGLFVSLDDSEFFEICKQYKVKSSFEEFSQNSWNHIHQTFNVNFKTNISTHLYRRIRNWFHFKLLDGKKTKEVRGKENRKIIGEKVYHTMRYLFDPKESARPEYVQFELIDELQKICKFPTFNKRGKCYFSRLYYDYNDDDNSNATKRKPPQKKRKANSKKARKTTQNNGPRLLWHQMIPAMLRLQSWIATTNSKRREDFITSSVNKSKRRKRKRKGNINNDEKQHMPQRLANKTAIPSKQRKRRKRRRSKVDDDDGESIYRARLHNFVVVPQHGFGLMHFAIDSKSLYDIVKNLSSFRPNGKPLYTQVEFLELIADAESANCKTINPFWKFLFNLTKLETDTKKFGGQIMTNSCDASVQLCKLKPGREMTREQVREITNNRKRKPSNANDSDSDSDSDAEDTDEEDDK